MSQWTHVAGAIRIDGIPSLTGISQEEEIKEIESLIGNTASYYDGEDAWDRCNVPCGSEGSIQRKFIFTGHDKGIGHSLSRGVVVIWADLRDYGDEGAIIVWLRKVLENFKIDNNKGAWGIRDVVLSIEVEGRKEKTLCTWNEKEIVTAKVEREID